MYSRLVHLGSVLILLFKFNFQESWNSKKVMRTWYDLIRLSSGTCNFFFFLWYNFFIFVTSIFYENVQNNFIVGSGVRPHPFYFTPTLFIKAPLILKIPDPHPFSNLYVSYIHFWCHGNVVDWHPIALLIYHFTYFQPEDIPIFSILFCKYKCTTWKSEEPHPL